MSAQAMQSKQWYEKRYLGREQKLGWNIGRPHCGLVEILARDWFKPARVLIPGCGLGYDAILLAEKGFDVLAFDFSVNAIRTAKSKANAKRRLKGKLQFVVEDIYTLPDSYHAAFDYVVEIGNFQAMSVKQRRQYVAVMHRVLVRSGRCIVLCKKYPPLTPGPPGMKKHALAGYFVDAFKVETVDSVQMYRDTPPRDGLRLIARKKG